MANYLVTGAAGFIGSAIARRLIGLGHSVWTIDNLTTGYVDNIPDGAVFLQGSCQDVSCIEQLEDIKFDAILHFAGQSSGEVSFDDPVYDLRTNAESTLRLIKYGLHSKCTRFIYASSMSVYGAVKDQAIAETHATAPLSFYGVGKLASENYMRIYAPKGLEFTALRFFNVYGPGQNMQNLRQGMVSIFLEQLLKQDIVIVKGPLNRFRDFIFIDDCVDVTIKTLESPKSIGSVYNIGTGVRTSVGQLLEEMMSISGLRKEIEVDIKGTPGDQKGIYADISLATKHLGFTHRYSLHDGLKRMIDWAIHRQ